MLQQLLRRAPATARGAVYLKPYTQPARSLVRKGLPWLLLPLLGFFCLVYGFYFALTAPYLITQFSFPLMLMSAFAIWALPDSRRNPSGLLEGFFFAFFICLVMWPKYLALVLPGLPWITMIRLTGFPLVFILLIATSISKEFRGQMAAILNSTPLIWKFLALFLLIQLITIPLAKNPLFTINRVINAQIAWTAMFFVGCFVFAKPGRAERWIALMWVLAMAVGLIGILEHPMGHVLWAGHIPSFFKVDDESVARILVGGTRMYGGGYRVQSTFSTALALAEFCALALPFVMQYAAGSYKPAVRIAAAASVIYLIYVIILTDSRLGLLGAFSAFLSYVLLRSLVEWRRRKDNILAPAVVFGFPVLLFLTIASTFVVGRIRTRIWGGQYQSSNDGRMEQLHMGIPKVLKQPIGHGMNSAGEVLGWVQPNGLLTIDIYWLATALDYGIIGFVAFYGFFILGIYNGFKQTMRSVHDEKNLTVILPLTISLLNFVIIKAVLADEANHSLPFMMMGMMVALVYRARQADQSKKLGETAPARQ